MNVCAYSIKIQGVRCTRLVDLAWNDPNIYFQQNKCGWVCFCKWQKSTGMLFFGFMFAAQKLTILTKHLQRNKKHMKKITPNTSCKMHILFGSDDHCINNSITLLQVVSQFSLDTHHIILGSYVLI